MTYPTVHLNGTPGDDLLEQVMNAIHATEHAHHALCAAGPNGRDYYVQEPGDKLEDYILKLETGGAR